MVGCTLKERSVLRQGLCDVCLTRARVQGAWRASLSVVWHQHTPLGLEQEIVRGTVVQDPWAVGFGALLSKVPIRQGKAMVRRVLFHGFTRMPTIRPSEA